MLRHSLSKGLDSNILALKWIHLINFMNYNISFSKIISWKTKKGNLAWLITKHYNISVLVLWLIALVTPLL